MIETIVLVYGVALVAGSYLMLKGIEEAPLGYEDENGFHSEPAPAKSYESPHLSELPEAISER